MITRNQYEEIYPLVNEIVVFLDSFAIHCLDTLKLGEKYMVLMTLLRLYVLIYFPICFIVILLLVINKITTAIVMCYLICFSMLFGLIRIIFHMKIS